MPYNLGTLPSVVVPHWPTAPTITREVQVSTSADFNSAASVNGTRVVVAAAITSGVTIHGSDIEVTMLPGASLGGLTVDHAVKRVALRGGTYNGQIELLPATQFYPTRVDYPSWIISDVMIDGVSVTSKATAFMLRGVRVAVLRSFAHAADYAVYTDMIAGSLNTDIILAGNRLECEGQQATVRLISVFNSIVVDNRITDLLLTGSKHCFRIHGTSQRVYAGRNLIINAGIMLGTLDGDMVSNVWIDGNYMFHKTADLFNPDRTRVRLLHAWNNIVYSDVWSAFWGGSVPAGWDISGNVVYPYRNPPK